MDELLRQLNEERKKARFLYLIYGVMMLAFLGFMLFDRYKAAIFIAALALLLYVGVVRGGVKSYERHYRKENILYYLGAYFETVKYEEKCTLTAEEFARTGLVEMNGRRGFLVRNQVVGRVDGMEAMAADVTFPVATVSGTGKESRRVVSGCFVTVRLWQPDTPISEETKKRLENGVYPEAVAGAVEALAEYTTGLVHVNVQDGQLNCLIERRFLAGRAPTYKNDLAEKDLREDQFPELRLVLEISRSFQEVLEKQERSAAACM